MTWQGKSLPRLKRGTRSFLLFFWKAKNRFLLN